MRKTKIYIILFSILIFIFGYCAICYQEKNIPFITIDALTVKNDSITNFYYLRYSLCENSEELNKTLVDSGVDSLQIQSLVATINFNKYDVVITYNKKARQMLQSKAQMTCDNPPEKKQLFIKYYSIETDKIHIYLVEKKFNSCIPIG